MCRPAYKQASSSSIHPQRNQTHMRRGSDQKCLSKCCRSVTWTRVLRWSPTGGSSAAQYSIQHAQFCCLSILSCQYTVAVLLQRKKTMAALLNVTSITVDQERRQARFINAYMVSSVNRPDDLIASWPFPYRSSMACVRAACRTLAYFFRCLRLLIGLRCYSRAACRSDKDGLRRYV